jgi:hypothetical protein
MKRILTISIVLLFFLSACSKKDPFENSMRAGKDALINHNFEDALKYFDAALIESPNNKDAISLYERTKHSIDEKLSIEKENEREQLMKDQIDDYIKSRMDIYSRIKNIVDSIDPDKGISVKGRIDKKEECKKIKSDIELLIDTETDGIIRLIDLRKNELDQLLISSITDIESSFGRMSDSPGSKYNFVGLGLAKEKLKEWNNTTKSYKS